MERNNHYPIILVHGFMGMGVQKDKYHGYFLEIAQQLGALPE